MYGPLFAAIRPMKLVCLGVGTHKSEADYRETYDAKGVEDTPFATIEGIRPTS